MKQGHAPLAVIQFHETDGRFHSIRNNMAVEIILNTCNNLIKNVSGLYLFYVPDELFAQHLPFILYIT